MPSDPSTTSRLQARVRELEADLAASKRDLRAARAREARYRQMITRQFGGRFTVDVDDTGSVCDLQVNRHGAVPKDDLRRIVTHAPGPAHFRRVVRTGKPTSFEAKRSNGQWVIHLFPDATSGASSSTSDGEAPYRLYGAVQASRSEHTPTPVSSETSDQTVPVASVHETQMLHRKLIELLPDSILIVGSDDRICYVNSAAVDLVGEESETDMLGTRIWNYVHPRYRNDAYIQKRTLGEDEEDGFQEIELLCADGTTVLVETASSPIRYRGDDAALVAVRDLSGRQRMAETISQTLDLFDKAFHLGPAALMILRLRDGLILEVNERVVTLSGHDTPGDLVGRTIDDIGVEVDDRKRRDLVRTLLRNRHLRNREFTVRDADGARHVLLAGARMTRIDGDACALLSLVDVTRRHRAAAAERESRALLQKIFRASPAPIGIIRLDDGRHIDVNDALCTLLGYPHDEIVGRSYSELDLWVNDERRQNLEDRLDTEDAVYDFEAQFRTATGDVVTTLCSFQRIRVNGEPCVVVVYTDITNREAQRRALIEAKEKAEEARAKAEEVAHFRSAVLSNMTHEIRTPLTVILGFTSMLREGVNEDYRRFVNLIERSGRRLLLTLDSLLDLGQIEAGTLEMDLKVMPIPQLVHSLSESLRRLARNDEVDLVFDVDSDDAADAFACVDEDLFGRVVLHLVDNAFKFTSDGSVTLRVDTTDDDVRVHVHDTGSGIDPEFMPRIYDAFSQESEGLTRSHQGSGLGLTVSQRIMERFDGSIDVESTKGEGTTVTLTLPRATREEHEAQADVPFP